MFVFVIVSSANVCVLADAYRWYVELSVFQTLLDSHPSKMLVIDERISVARTIDQPSENDESVRTLRERENKRDKTK